MRALVSSMVVGLLAVGCGGGGTASGFVQGQQLDVRDAVALQWKPSGVNRLDVILRDKGGICADENALVNRGGASTLQLTFMSLSTISTGRYEIPASGGQAGVSVSASFRRVNLACDSQLSFPTLQPTGGVIQLNTLSPTGAEGTFELTFASDHLSGEFNASNCKYEPGTGSTHCG
jgi:hypothetical protein